MKTWFNKVQKKKFKGNRINKKRTLLIIDSFENHKTNVIKNIALNINTDLAIIPDDLTFVIQLLDVCFNKPFKDRLCEKWNA